MNRLLAILLLSVTALLLLGILMLDSATVREPVPHRFQSHLIWIALGTGCGLAAGLTDYGHLRRFRIPVLLLAAAGLVLAILLVPRIGVLVNGARRWLPFGGQPSEFAKLGLIVWLADYGTVNQGRMQEKQIGFVYPAAIGAIMAGLIFIEPDWGTAALVASVGLAMLLVAGTRWRYITAISLAGLGTFALLVLFNPLRLERLLSFTDPEKYQDGVGWQGWHSVLSIGAGGVWGSFFGEGSHKYGFVPEQQTDFIFSLIGEELGFVGTTFVVLLFATIILCGTRIAWRITDPFGQLLACGLTLLIGLQAFINIGVCTSSLPNKGIALPFISYGGSNLVCMLIAVGLLTSIARSAPRAPRHRRSKLPAKSASPFASVASHPHRAYATELASVLLRRKRTVWSRVISWLRKRRASRHPQPPLRSYQRLPAKAQPFDSTSRSA